MFSIIPVKTFKTLLAILNLEVLNLILICCNSIVMIFTCLVPTDLNRFVSSLSTDTPYSSAQYLFNASTLKKCATD